MSLHDQLSDRFNLIRTISYHKLFQDGPLINLISLDQSNLLDQPSELIF